MNNEQEVREYLNQVIDDIWQNFEQYDRKDIAEMINEVYVTGVGYGYNHGQMNGHYL